MKPIYIVSGYMRTGTSMMMKALIVGGMDAVYDTKRDEHLAAMTSDDDWTIQHGESVYEPSDQRFREFGFPRQYEGKLLKVLFGGLPALAPHAGGYHYVFMERDPEEIRQSYEGAFTRARAAKFLSDGTYRDVMALARERLWNRKDTKSVTTFQYRQVVRCPEKAMAHLRDIGWPIEVERSKVVPDLEMVRFRVEDLEVGI